DGCRRHKFVDRQKFFVFVVFFFKGVGFAKRRDCQGVFLAIDDGRGSLCCKHRGRYEKRRDQRKDDGKGVASENLHTFSGGRVIGSSGEPNISQTRTPAANRSVETHPFG